MYIELITTMCDVCSVLMDMILSSPIVNPFVYHHVLPLLVVPPVYDYPAPHCIVLLIPYAVDVLLARAIYRSILITYSPCML